MAYENQTLNFNQTTKTIVWDNLVSKRIKVVTASKEMNIAMDNDAADFDEKYEILAEAKWSLSIAEISWKEYNEAFGGL